VRIALVHDFLLDVRGAERVFLSMCELWPEADVFTAVYDERGTEGRFAHRNVQTTFLQKLRPTARTFRALLPLYPYAIESLDLRDYDLVVSSSSAWAHGVIVDDHTTHVSYCYNPFRYAWNAREATLSRRPPPLRAALAVIFSRWRQWDWMAAQHVDQYIAISDTTRRRIERYWGRPASIVHPPVQVERFSPVERDAVGDYYLVLAELMSHKRIDVAVRAFNSLGRPLVIVGDGPEQRRLARMAGPGVRFAGRATDEQVASLLQRCRALVVTATEEFGLAAVEAQAAGRPVIALADGGVLETVRTPETGAFYARPDPRALAAAVEGFDDRAVDPAVCVANAELFSARRFHERLSEEVARACERDASEPVPRVTRRPLHLAGRARARA
jgi:glycosyltransferase involved in cell wall biosynthesis